MNPGDSTGIATLNLSRKLLNLEKRLMDPAVRKDRTQISTLISDDFREFGSSGRVWTKAAILEELATEIDYTAPSVEDFTLAQIAPDAILATYRTVRPPNKADAPVKETLRSSLWTYRDNRWQMLFHQGTSVET